MRQLKKYLVAAAAAATAVVLAATAVVLAAAAAIRLEAALVQDRAIAVSVAAAGRALAGQSVLAHSHASAIGARWLLST